MWILKQPTVKELDSYEQKVMPGLIGRVLGCGDSSIVDALAPLTPKGGRGKSILKILLRGTVYDSLNESEQLMGQIIPAISGRSGLPVAGSTTERGQPAAKRKPKGDLFCDSRSLRLRRCLNWSWVIYHSFQLIYMNIG